MLKITYPKHKGSQLFSLEGQLLQEAGSTGFEIIIIGELVLNNGVNSATRMEEQV